jgi:DNA-directed RNA polymerase sigma subunit (sigma70/sigma32)
MSEQVRKVMQVGNRFATSRGHEPTNEQIAEDLGWALEKVENALRHGSDATTLDKPIYYGDSGAFAELGDFIEDRDDADAPAAVIGEMEAGHLGRAIAEMNEPGRRVLIRRYGLDGGDRATLKELADELELSRERVGQLQIKAGDEIKDGRYYPLPCNHQAQ